MRTLYLRNVPPGVVERLEVMAEGLGMSVSAFVVNELKAVARRADNPALLASLPDLAVSADALVAELDAARDKR